MVRNSYNIVKAEVLGSCKYYGSHYELEVWYDDYDLEKRGSHIAIDMDNLRSMAHIQRGNGFKKVQVFLDSDEGRNWLAENIKAQDIDKARDKIKDYVRGKMYDMTLSDLQKVKTCCDSIKTAK